MGYGIEVFRPCESLLMTGRDISEQHDGDYGAWVADAYGATLAASRPTFQSVRAQINVTAGQAVEGRYDRLLLPWRGARGERYVMGVSVTRAHRRFAGPPPGLAAAAV